MRWAEVAIGLLVVGAVVAAFMIVSRRPTTSLTAIPEKSIAVLPFVNMSDGQGTGVLLRRHLGGTAQPAGEDSAAARDGAHLVVLVQGQGGPDPGDRAHAARGPRTRGLGAQGGQPVRITAQLIRAGTDTHLWSQTYDRKLDDIFAIQDEISARTW